LGIYLVWTWFIPKECIYLYQFFHFWYKLVYTRYNFFLKVIPGIYQNLKVIPDR
jgi:hypothetical protein